MTIRRKGLFGIKLTCSPPGNRLEAEFKCSVGATLYLVRAAYLNGGTGNFELFWARSALVVSHASLGSATNLNKSALIACLSKQPSGDIVLRRARGKVWRPTRILSVSGQKQYSIT